MPISEEEHWAIVAALGSAVARGDASLGNVPGLLRRVLEEQLWQRFEVPGIGIVEYESTPDGFRKFVTTNPVQGLGASIKVIRKMIADDETALDAFDAALQNPVGYNITTQNGRSGGTAITQALRRLRKDRPDLLARVLDGELSPHAAAIEAGFRHPTATIQIDDPERIVATLKRRLDPDTLDAVIQLLSG